MEQVKFVSVFYNWLHNDDLRPNIGPSKSISIRDRIRGSLIGGAAGDQLGYPVEFKSYKRILSEYGEKGAIRFSGEKVVSDDTQMTLFTACGLLNAVRDGIDPKVGICRAYAEWYRTQVGKVNGRNNECWITSIPELNVTRAPGMTCMSAMQSIINGRKPANSSKGCGGVMRIAPVALYGAASGGDVYVFDRLAGDAAEITHQHPLGIIPAAFMSHLIYRLTLDENPTRESMLGYIDEAFNTITALYTNNTTHVAAFRSMIDKAVSLSSVPLFDYECIREIGEGWTGDEAVAIAVYCCLRHFDDFEAALIAAVNHDGDSDSTGAVTGNILGAVVGYDAIPEFFKKDLELHDVILLIADDLWRGETTQFVSRMKTEKNMNDSQYITFLTEAYLKGHKLRTGRDEAPKLHYFKNKEDLPRVQQVLGFLWGVIPFGQVKTLLDVGSGRGAFLFPLLRDFPDLDVTSIDILPHRVELLQDVHNGGVSNLTALDANLCTWDAPDESFDAVTLLEVLEHIPDTEAAVRNAVRLAKQFVIVSVPSKPDDNPEHIHLFSDEDLRGLFTEAGCRKVKFSPVAGHRVMIAYKNG